MSKLNYMALTLSFKRVNKGGIYFQLIEMKSVFCDKMPQVSLEFFSWPKLVI